MNRPIEIHLNGDVTELAQGEGLMALITSLNVNLKNVAIELNQRIIPRSQLSDVTLKAGDRVEVVEFIGGG